MKNSEAFLDAFAAIERHLRSVIGADRSASFYQLVDSASRSRKVVGRYRDDLKEYADLRNAIVHERSDGHVIAEPNDSAVAQIGHLRTLLLDPPKLLPTFQVAVRTHEATASIGDAAVTMLQGSFSQVPVLENGSVKGVLTANTIARWLGHEVSADIFSLRETSITTVLGYTEDPENHTYLPRSASCFAALAKFEDFATRGKDLDAVLITNSGRAEEGLLGILTVYDLPKLLGIVGLSEFTTDVRYK